MLIAHLGFQSDMGGLLNFHHYTFLRLYDAEFFVTISGLLVGVLTMRKIDDSQYFYGFVKRRLFVIYKYYLISAIPAIATTAFQEGNFIPLADILKYVAGVGLIQNGGLFSDILPIYFYCFLVMAACYFVAQAFGWASMIAVSFMIYVAGQMLLVRGFFGISAGFVVFNIAAWQFLFSAAFVVGIYHKQILQWIYAATDQTRLSIFVLCLTGFWYFNFFGKSEILANAALITGESMRFHLHPYYLISIVCICVGFALVMLNSPKILKPVTQILEFYFSLKFLRNIGTYSIQMFVIHVYLMAIFTKLGHNMEVNQRWVLALTLIAIYVAIPNVYVWFKSMRASSPHPSS